MVNELRDAALQSADPVGEPVAAVPELPELPVEVRRQRDELQFVGRCVVLFAVARRRRPECERSTHRRLSGLQSVLCVPERVAGVVDESFEGLLALHATEFVPVLERLLGLLGGRLAVAPTSPCILERLLGDLEPRERLQRQ